MSSNKREMLANDLLQMVDNPQLSDVTLVCEDGVEVHACRMVLAARSSFFRQMLLNGMAESTATSIALPTVSSPVLLIVLKFLYAEVLLDEDIQNKKSRRESLTLNWELLLKVVVAVRFIMLEQLEKVIIGRLWGDVHYMDWKTNMLDAQDKTAVACNLSILCEYSMLWNADEVKCTDDASCSRSDPARCTVESIEVICFHLMQFMIFSELSTATLFHFSKKAFHFYLSETQRTSRDQTWDWSFEEYLRLRDVITWCAVKAADTGAAIENLDCSCLPGPEIAMRFLRECVKSSQDDSRSIFSNGRESFVKNILRKDLEKVLPMIDLVSIHPQLLVTVIEPLNLTDPQDLSRTYRTQAVRGSRWWRDNGMTLSQVTDVWHWAGCGLYSFSKRCSNDLSFSVSVNPSGARERSLVSAAELKMEFSRSTFEWEIVVSKHGHLEQNLIHVEIGFYRLRRGESFGTKMGKHRCRPLSASRSRGSVLSISNSKLEFFDKLLTTCHSIMFSWGTPIKVVVNRQKGTCSFSSGGTKHSFAIASGERETFYPVLYLSTGSHWDYRSHYDRLTVQIQNLKGFDQADDQSV